MAMTVDELISQLSNKLTSNPDSINSDIINKLNKLRTNNPNLVERLQSAFKEYNIHVSPKNNKLHMSRYYNPATNLTGPSGPLPSKGGKRHKKHTRRHKKQKRTRRHRKH